MINLIKNVILNLMEKTSKLSMKYVSLKYAFISKLNKNN